ncbi:MAG: hypothetical protein K1X51_05225 [Rhodospirillaceae bacterium]|nr:hypothetical protein [Rhodospirillaceae bacterium]
MGTRGNPWRRLRQLIWLLALIPAALPALAQIEPFEADDTAIPRLPVSRETSRPEKPAALPSRPLRLLLGYTPKALTDMPDIHTVAAQIVSQINLTLANSNVALTVELAGMDRVDYTEAADETSGSMLNAVTTGTGDFTRLAALRQVVKADLVMVMAHWVYDNNCGRGWQLDALDNGATSLAEAARFGISVLSTDTSNCATVRSAPHEIGHNLGAAHDRYVTPGAAPGPASYNYGYVDAAARVRDMMAYANECTAQGLRCVRLFIYADPDIMYNGRPLGVPVASPKAAAAARRIREIAPYVVQFRDTLRGTANMLAVTTTGQGTVAGPAIDCGPSCSAEYAESASVTLSARPAAGWRFAGWGGACAGLTCTVAMNGGKAVSAAFIPALHLGGIGAASVLRFANTGAAAGRVAVNLTNPVTGADLGRWTSPAIAPNASRDFTTAEITRNIVPGTALPATYAVTVEPEFQGTVQHISSRANLSTCDAGVTGDPEHLSQVTASSTVVVAQSVRGNDAVDSGAHDAASATFGVFDARDGTRLGAYTTPVIPRNGQLMIPAADIERGLAVRAPAYNIAVEGAFSGYLQHLAINAGVVADMTTACAFTAPAPVFDTNALIQPGPVFSDGAGGQSYLRFFNTGTAAGTVNVTLANPMTGVLLGQWTSPAIAPNAARQFPLSEIEAALPGPRSATYTALVQTQIAGTLQHVLWRADGTLVNASTCDVGVGANATQVANVHAPLIAGYASSLVLTNTGATASATLGLYDAATGQRRGSYVTAPVPGGGQLTLPMTQILASLSSPGNFPGAVLHYVVKIENTFPGFIQHLVTSAATGVVTDLTAACTLPVPSIRYEMCDPASPCALSPGANVAGQLKSQYLTDNYRVTLAAGRTVTIEIKGRDSGAGTLFAPRLVIYGADPATPLANVTTGGAGRDVRYQFSPPASGIYTLVVSARESGYSTEDDFQVINPTMGTYRISVN